MPARSYLALVSAVLAAALLTVAVGVLLGPRFGAGALGGTMLVPLLASALFLALRRR